MLLNEMCIFSFRFEFLVHFYIGKHLFSIEIDNREELFIWPSDLHCILECIINGLAWGWASTGTSCTSLTWRCTIVKNCNTRHRNEWNIIGASHKYINEWKKTTFLLYFALFFGKINKIYKSWLLHSCDCNRFTIWWKLKY